MQRAFLTPRLPDGDRTWLTLGARYMINPKLAVGLADFVFAFEQMFGPGAVD